MPYQLIATDMDGTLLNEQGILTPRTRAAVQALQRSGIMVVLSSGRSSVDMLPAYAELALSGPLIASHGALICQPGQPEPLLHRPIPTEVALQVVAALRSFDPELNISAELGGASHVDRVDTRVAATLARGVTPPPIVGDVAAAIGASAGGPTRLALHAASVREAIKAHLARAGLAGAVCTTAAGGDGFEILAAGVNKGSALLWLAGRLGIAQAATVALGDQENDLVALQVAGLGIAMGNASERVQQAAQVVTGPNSADGWADALERHVLDVLLR